MRFSSRAPKSDSTPNNDHHQRGTPQEGEQAATFMFIAYAAAKRGPPVGQIRTAANQDASPARASSRTAAPRRNTAFPSLASRLRRPCNLKRLRLADCRSRLVLRKRSIRAAALRGARALTEIGDGRQIPKPSAAGPPGASPQSASLPRPSPSKTRPPRAAPLRALRPRASGASPTPLPRSAAPARCQNTI